MRGFVSSIVAIVVALAGLPAMVTPEATPSTPAASVGVDQATSPTSEATSAPEATPTPNPTDLPDITATPDPSPSPSPEPELTPTPASDSPDPDPSATPDVPTTAQVDPSPDSAATPEPSPTALAGTRSMRTSALAALAAPSVTIEGDFVDIIVARTQTGTGHGGIAQCGINSSNTDLFPDGNLAGEPADGVIRISVPGPGDYRVVETKAPDGYVLDETPLAGVVELGIAVTELGAITNVPSPSPTPSPTPSPRPTPTPTPTPEPSPTPSATPEPTPTPSPTPSAEPTPSATPEPAPIPSATPTPQPVVPPGRPTTLPRTGVTNAGLLIVVLVGLAAASTGIRRRD